MSVKKRTYAVELTNSEKEVAHKRLQNWEAPDIFEFSKRYFKETGKIYEVEGYAFLNATIKEIDNSFTAETEHNLCRFINWFRRNAISYSYFGGNPPVVDARFGGNFIRTTKGIWAFCDQSRSWCLTTAAGPEFDYDFTPVKDKSAMRWTTNCKNVGFDEFGVPELKEIIYSFTPNWKRARIKYRKKIKAEGVFAKKQAQEQKKKEVQKTQVRVDLLTHLGSLIQELEIYKAQVSGDDVDSLTRKRIRKVFDMTTELTWLNKRLRITYGIK